MNNISPTSNGFKIKKITSAVLVRTNVQKKKNFITFICYKTLRFSFVVILRWNTMFSKNFYANSNDRDYLDSKASS